MSAAITVTIHPSQFPAEVRKELSRSLRERTINHKFHYDSYKQTEKWLRLHERYSPARTDPDCERIYDSSFAGVRAMIGNDAVHVVGLGCGGGQKDTRLLRLLCASAKKVRYTALDVSAAMVLTAIAAAGSVTSDTGAIVADLPQARDLVLLIDARTNPGTKRIYTFFGMLPNFEPGVILPILASLLRPDDLVLASANLAPGQDYRKGVETIAPLYENQLTHEWLMTFLLDLGVEASDGHLQWVIEGDAHLRLAAYFVFGRERIISLNDEEFSFCAGDRMRLFFSYRYTPVLTRELFEEHGLTVHLQWITQSEEEGVFLCRRTSGGEKRP